MKKIGIIGGGISGLMCAYILRENPDIQVCIIEQGDPIEKRQCPLLSNLKNKCANCKSCAITEGLGGAGAFSDGKYNITNEFGGWLQHFMSDSKVIEYEEKAINILSQMGSENLLTFYPNNELKKICLQNNLTMLQSRCIHLGTDKNYNTMCNLIHSFDNYKNVEIYTNSQVTDVEDFSDFKEILFKKNKTVHSLRVDEVVFAVGRVGTSFFKKWCENNSVPLCNNQVDIGVRVELPATIWEDFDKKIYEPKISYKTKQYGDTCRMFCHNPRGEVVLENNKGILTVNGHAYASEEKKTNNTNFALLSTINFTEPFKEPIEYAKHIARLSNMVSGSSVIVQTLGDLEKGRRSTNKRIEENYVKPTLSSAMPGDLGLCVPKRQLDNIIETLHALDKIAPGTANPSTLLYGVECKYYSARPLVTEDFEIKSNGRKKLQGYYAIGDGTGITRSLAQAAALGVLVGEILLGG